MEKFKVYQIRLTDAEINIINDEGHDAVHKNSLRLSMNFGKNDINEISFEYINKFLDENILVIEKKLNSFIEKIILIIDSDDFIPIEISVKKQNYNQPLTQESLIYSLNEAKDECKKNFEEKKIAHMIIKNYIIDNNEYSSLPKNKICNNFSLDIKFICIPINL